MTYQENKNKGDRPKAKKGKARTMSISTRLTLTKIITRIYEVTITLLMELSVQLHQNKIPYGGGNESDCGENDNKK